MKNLANKLKTEANIRRLEEEGVKVDSLRKSIKEKLKNKIVEK